MTIRIIPDHGEGHIDVDEYDGSVHIIYVSDPDDPEMPHLSPADARALAAAITHMAFETEYR